MKFTKTLVGVVAALAFSSAAFAADGDSNWYVGVGVGQTQSRFNSDDFKANSAVIAAGYTENVYQTTSPTSYDVYAGYRLSQHFAAQVGYTDFGTLVYGSNVSGGAGLPGVHGHPDRCDRPGPGPAGHAGVRVVERRERTNGDDLRWRRCERARRHR